MTKEAEADKKKRDVRNALNYPGMAINDVAGNADKKHVEAYTFAINNNPRNNK